MNKYNPPSSPLLFLLSLIIISLSGCLAVHSSRTFTDTDEAVSEVRTRKKFYFRRELEKKTPFISLEKTFFKVQEAHGHTSISVFDILTLDHGSFDVGADLYVIVDGRAYPVKGRQETPELFIHTSTDTETIMTADSNEIDIVSGYSRDQWKLYRISYAIDTGILNNIRNAREVLFRYYAGPEMMTVRLRGPQLNALKKIL